MPTDEAPEDLHPPSIVVKNLTYKFPNGAPGLTNVSLDLPPGSRTLLIGGEAS